MSVTNLEKTESPPANLLYHKLIWPIFTLVVLFMFKSTIEKLIAGSDDVAVEVLGVKIKIAKSDIDELSVIQEEFEKELNGLNDTINQQNTALSALSKLNQELEAKAKNCPGIQAATTQFNKDVDKIIQNNTDLKSKTTKFRDKKLFRIPNDTEKKE